MKHPHQNLKAATIKEAIDPYDFYLREQGIRDYGNSSGGAWKVAGICPFHDDSKSGSFKVNVETGAFKCWSCGAIGGDVIAFKQQQSNLSFLEVLGELACEWGVPTC